MAFIVNGDGCMYDPRAHIKSAFCTEIMTSLAQVSEDEAGWEKVLLKMIGISACPPSMERSQTEEVVRGCAAIGIPTVQPAWGGVTASAFEHTGNLWLLLANVLECRIAVS